MGNKGQLARGGSPGSMSAAVCAPTVDQGTQTANSSLVAAHEQREAARRERNYQNEQINRYYAQQRTADAISSNMVKDELKRHTRMTKQLAEEQRVLEELYQVSTWHHATTRRGCITCTCWHGPTHELSDTVPPPTHSRMELTGKGPAATSHSAGVCLKGLVCSTSRGVPERAGVPKGVTQAGAAAHLVDRASSRTTFTLCLPQAETHRQLAAVTAAESDALAAALSRKMQMQEASGKEVQRLREESAELRE